MNPIGYGTYIIKDPHTQIHTNLDKLQLTGSTAFQTSTIKYSYIPLSFSDS